MLAIERTLKVVFLKGRAFLNEVLHWLIGVYSLTCAPVLATLLRSQYGVSYSMQLDACIDAEIDIIDINGIHRHIATYKLILQQRTS